MTTKITPQLITAEEFEEDFSELVVGDLFATFDMEGETFPSLYVKVSPKKAIIVNNHSGADFTGKIKPRPAAVVFSFNVAWSKDRALLLQLRDKVNEWMKDLRDINAKIDEGELDDPLAHLDNLWKRMDREK